MPFNFKLPGKRSFFKILTIRGLDSTTDKKQIQIKSIYKYVKQKLYTPLRKLREGR